MLTVNDIKDAKFRRTNIGGYKAEDVDNFLDEVQISYEKLQKENLNLTQKIKILADRVSQYKKDEDSVKIALVGAQKLANSAIADAKKEANTIIENAKKEANFIVNNANREIMGQKETLINLKKAVKDFRSNILSLYKEHKLVNSFNAEDRLPADFKDKIKSPSNDDFNPEELDIHSDSGFEQDDCKTEPENAQENISSEKFSDLKFGEDYDVSKDLNEEPVGLLS